MVGPSMPPSSNLMCWRNHMMISVLGETKSSSNTLPFFYNSQDIKTLQLLLSLSKIVQTKHPHSIFISNFKFKSSCTYGDLWMKQASRVFRKAIRSLFGGT
ncbi:hypothetical protein Hanom_Chr16g01439631 [Helianthus anomalus]